MQSVFDGSNGGIDVSKPKNNSLEWSDITIVAIYFLIVIITGLYAMYRSNRGTVKGYFLAGRFMVWLPVGASIFAANVGSEHFIGLAGSAAATGIGVAAFEFNALLILQMTGWIFLPVFIASKVNTLPEYMSKRFGGKRIRTYLAILSMLLYIFTKISVNLYSGAIFIQQSLGWNLYISVVGLLLITSISTVTGGLTAVIYTDTFQTLVIIVGATTVTVKGLIEVGGFHSLVHKYMNAIPSVVADNMTECALPNKRAFQMLRPLDDPDMPWLGFILGQTPASIWYWCADQMMVQRLLASKSLSHAQGGTIFAGFLKITPLFLMVIPGMISRVLYTEEVACVDPAKCLEYCNSEVSCTNIAYPKLVLGLMPSPLKGLILAVMLAALMSDLSSVFNSSSTLFTCDIWPLIRKKAKMAELMIVGRSFVLVMVVISILWIPIIQEMQNGQLFIYIQDIAANLSPPIAAVYILAIIYKRINECGAFWSLIIGLVAGVIRMIVGIVFREAKCGEQDLRPQALKLHYMYFAVVLFWLTVISAIIISHLTEPTEEYRLIRTTFWTRFDKKERKDDNTFEDHHNNNDIVMTVVTNGQNKENVEEVKQRGESKVKQLFSWFCGINYKPKTETIETIETTESKEAKEVNISSISQTKFQKAILSTFLLFVVTLAITLYIYFSIPLESRF